MFTVWSLMGNIGSTLAPHYAHHNLALNSEEIFLRKLELMYLQCRWYLALWDTCRLQFYFPISSLYMYRGQTPYQCACLFEDNTDIQDHMSQLFNTNSYFHIINTHGCSSGSRIWLRGAPALARSILPM